MLLLAACIVTSALVGKADAQVAHVTYFAPAVPVTAYYAPAGPIPVTTYYAPAAVVAPAPVVTYRPVPVATTRYRPILGGTVTRIRTSYAPVVVTPPPIVYGY